MGTVRLGASYVRIWSATAMSILPNVVRVDALEVANGRWASPVSAGISIAGMAAIGVGWNAVTVTAPGDRARRAARAA
jgi:hypothetical protein